jgi:hypothetical protein
MDIMAVGIGVVVGLGMSGIMFLIGFIRWNGGNTAANKLLDSNFNDIRRNVKKVCAGLKKVQGLVERMNNVPLDLKVAIGNTIDDLVALVISMGEIVMLYGKDDQVRSKWIEILEDAKQYEEPNDNSTPF